MATQRLVNTNFWRDTYVIDLDPIQKLLFLYFLTNPQTTLIGVYEISLRQTAFDTGIDKDMVEKILTKFVEDGKMYYQNGWLILNNFVKHQRLNPSMKTGIVKIFMTLPEFIQNEVLQRKSFDILQWSEYTDYPQSGSSLQQSGGNIIKLNKIKYNKIESNVPASPPRIAGSKIDQDLAAKEHAAKNRKPNGSGYAKASEIVEQIKLRSGTKLKKPQ